MRQRLFKIILCMILMVSVFLSHSLVAVAADGEEDWPDVPGHFDGPYIFHGFLGRSVPISSDVYTVDDNTYFYTRSFSGDFTVGYLSLELQSGYSYDGTIKFLLTVPYSFSNLDALLSSYISISVLSCSGSGWVSYGRSALSRVAGSGSLAVEVTVQLNNYSVSTGVDVLIPIMVSVSGFARGESFTSPVTLDLGSPTASAYTNNLWEAAQAYDGSTVQYYIYEQTKLIEKNDKAAMEQQQQIADQQAEQSRQQHDEQLHGFQDDAYNGAVSSAGGTVNDYVAAEGELMDSQHQQINDYADQNFNTGLIANYTTAIASVSTWYTQIWMSFGDFKTVFTVILSLGIAAALIGLKRFGGG